MNTICCVPYVRNDPHTTAGWRLIILPLWHASLCHPAANTRLPEGQLCMCTYNCPFFASFFGHISSCSHLYPKRQRGWAQFSPLVHVAEGLGAILQWVARGKPSELFWPWAYSRHLPGFPQHPASIPYPRYSTYEGFDANPKEMSTSNARTRLRGNIRSVFCPLMNTAMSTTNTQRAQRQKSAAQQHQQAPPCVCSTSIYVVLLWLVDFFGACFVCVIDNLYFAAAVRGIAILEENIRTVWI